MSLKACFENGWRPSSVARSLATGARAGLLRRVDGRHARSGRRPAEYVFNVPPAPVAQTCSLLYRRFLTCHLPPASHVLPITNRRYSRLKICATPNGYPADRNSREQRCKNARLIASNSRSRSVRRVAGYVFSGVGTSGCDVRAAFSGATPSNATVARTFVPPATTRPGTAQRAIPTIALNTDVAGRHRRAACATIKSSFKHALHGRGASCS